MTEENVETLKENYRDKLKKEKLDALAKDWAKLDDDKCAKFQNVKLKSQAVAVLLAVFLGWLGSNRYYIGPTLLGALRLAATVAITTVVTLLLKLAFSTVTLIIAIIICVAFLVVYILEIVYSYKDCETVNYNKLVKIYNGIVTHTAVKEEKESILAIIGYVCSFYMPVVGLVCSAVGYCSAKSKSLKNKGLAIAGMAISSATIALAIVLLFAL